MKLQSACKRRLRVATLRPVVLALVGAGYMSAALAGDLPEFTKNTPVAGSGSYKGDGNVMTVTQTSRRAVWEASNFSISEGFTFANNFTGVGKSLTLVRVTGPGQSSFLNGTLTANNTFMLVNPYGIYVGPKAVITAAHMLMSAKDLKSELVASDYNAFMNGGHLVFDTNTNNGYGDSTIDISPGAKLTATADGGSIYLVGDNVRNQGALTAGQGGSVGLLAVPSAEFDVGDSGFITMTAYTNFNYAATGYGQDLTNRVAVNTGTIDAPNGAVTLVGVGRSSNGRNRFDIRDAAPPNSIVSTPLYQSGVDGSYGSGAFNSGTITADKGKVALIAQGPGSIAAVTGRIAAKAISMSGETVRVGLYGGADGQLAADGSDGGGIIDLGDSARLDGDTTNTKWIYVSGATGNGQGNSKGSTLSASATDKGDGGSIKLSAMYAASAPSQGAALARRDYGQVEAYGQFTAQGGLNGGAGGSVAIQAQQVNLSYNGMKARFVVAPQALRQVNGSVSVTTPYLNIGYDGAGYGGHYEPVSGESWIDPDVITQTLQGGADVSLKASSEGHQTAFSKNSHLSMQEGVQLGSSGLGQRKLKLESDNAINMAANTGITAFAGEGGNGPLDIEMVAKSGGLQLGDSSEPAPVRITTLGGKLTLNGVNTKAGDSSNAGVYVSNGNIDTRGATGTEGLLTINGTGGAQAGVQIENNTTLSGTRVLIKGVSQTGTGVALSDTTVTGVTRIEVHGLSQQAAATPPVEVAFLAAAAGPQQVAPLGPAGVDIGSGVVFNAGQGSVTILGRSASGDGVRIKDLTLVTSAMGAVRQRFTVAGESSDGGMGVNVLAGGSGIQMHDEAGPALASTADVVIGGTSSGHQGQTDIELGTPQWNTTGSVNIRPLSVTENGTAISMADNLTKPIHLGSQATAQAGDFVVKPQWFNATANGAFGSNVNMVIGSKAHLGQITAANGALNGAGTLTLQNQGVGSAGIQLGPQQTAVQVLNLVTEGDITQTGAFKANALRIIAGASSKVTLNSAQNEIGAISYNKQAAGVAPEGVAASAALANAGADGIVSYDQGDSTFKLLSVVAAPASPNTEPPREPDQPIKKSVYDVEVPRPFDGPDALNDLRTDVYVHGQLGRPQICTAANTSGSATGLSGGAEPLALEWVKVRRSAQLSNCSGVQADSSCSAF